MKKEEAFVLFKKLPFSKSWQNNFVSKDVKKFNTETRQLEDLNYENFIYSPAPSLVRHFGNDKAFLLFRTDNKTSKDWNFNLVADPVENNNRRLVIMYLSNIMDALDIKFEIDGSYTLYISGEEIQKLENSDIPGAKDFYNSLYVPKSFAQKKGSSDTWT